jgi:hypothetical protein
LAGSSSPLCSAGIVVIHGLICWGHGLVMDGRDGLVVMDGFAMV